MRITFPNRTVIGALLAITILAGAAGLGMFLQHERAQELDRWHIRLDRLATTRSQRVSNWVNAQFRELTRLSTETPLQRYTGHMETNTDQSGLLDQEDDLRQQLTSAAQRLGYTAGQDNGGLAILDVHGKLLLSTDRMPPLAQDVADQIASNPRNEVSLLDIAQQPDGTPHVGFVVPIYAAQDDPASQTQVGSLVAIKPLDAAFFAKLAPEDASEKTLDVALVRMEGHAVRYLSPLHDTSAAMSRLEAFNSHSAAAFAVMNPQQFAEKTDYSGADVLVTGQNVPATPWVVLAKIDRGEALAAAGTWRTLVIAAAVLGLAALTAAFATFSALRERGKRVQTLQQLVALTVSLIDRRDPHAAKHSGLVSLLAKATAVILKLDRRAIETAETAASLINLGKSGIPTEWLTRSGALNADERSKIRNAMATSAQLLEEIAFDGPVAETLHHAQEFVDGSGPMQLQGDQILLSARIIAVANAFVGMVSPRAYRAPLSVDEALIILGNNAGLQFDADVIEALTYYLDEQGGRETLRAQLYDRAFTPLQKRA